MDRDEREADCRSIGSTQLLLKSLAEIFDKMRISTDDIIVRGIGGDIQHVARVVSKDLVEEIIRCYHEGPGSSHQAAKATTAKIARTFY